MISGLYWQLKEIVEKEFSDIVETAEIIKSPAGRPRKIRFTLIDGTFVDIWYSLSGEYSFHWEQASKRSYLYRHDNAPHLKWSYVKTFPRHCHDGSHANVVESYLPQKPDEALLAFFSIVRKKLMEFGS